MKFARATMVLIAACLIFPSVAGAADQWVIDKSRSSAHFEVRHLMVSSVTGQFGDVSGKVDYDGEHLEKANVEAAIAVKSLDTQMPMRDEHIRSAFDMATNPAIEFRSTKIVPHAGGKFDIYGTLSMHGVSQNVVLSAKPLETSRSANGQEYLTTSATTVLNRKQFGISVDKAIDHGGTVIGDNVSVTLQIALIRKP